MKNRVLKVQSQDNLIVALDHLKKGEVITYNNKEVTLIEAIAPKHKFNESDLKKGEEIFMYGVLVGKAEYDIPAGSMITTFNVKHAAAPFKLGERKLTWEKPEQGDFKDKTFQGYHRANGSVGTANYWIVLPLVFCENRNLDVIKDALVNQLGYGKSDKYKDFAQDLISKYQKGEELQDILTSELQSVAENPNPTRIFENVDGVKFLNHDMGCGGTRQDAQSLCGLLAGYIAHPNVAGATVLSLGCQNAQYSILQEELLKRQCTDKPIVFLEQQEEGTEEKLITEAIKETFTGLMEANKQTRQAAPLSKLVLGLECGGSDGFSGISANPTLGYVSDLLVTLGGTTILSEFPELCGVEQELSDRCVDEETALKFNSLMTAYAASAVRAGSGFDMNPSPGNIKDGLITDAIKSAGAAKKGGTSPVTDVLDYPEMVSKKGLNLLCTPGNDVESTTGMVGSGANIVLFTTGLGTPTGNPIAPVIKVASNTKLSEKMPDIIDINTGPIIEGEENIEDSGRRMLDYIIAVASGETQCKAVINQQDDFIPWKRGVSL
ncbi:UxaA family hydrolase [Arcticibacterium luteifluviistationis]|uniref:Altronate hydrolase n=1 Tax=Arcticibacterium luteifluviistationis TaxID=1784714 RepID=A0A2Z4G9W8_9BACT|nr:altronate dehydratase family protein [Arcticibacterium luteifluviistationis]AWV97713.1 altronate hydrolase [Arcticibacterium luteifluviistationis]